MEQNEHIEHALWIISLLKIYYNTLTIESIFDWITEMQYELKQSDAEYDEALKIITIIKAEFADLTSEHVFNQILKIEELIKTNN